MLEHKPIIVISGRKGTGKTSLAKLLSKHLNLPYISSREYYERKAKERNISPTRQNLEALVSKLHKEKGMEKVMREMMSKVKLHKGAIVDGIRFQSAIEHLRKKFGGGVFVIGLEASARERFARIKKRGNEESRQTFEEFLKGEKTRVENHADEVVAKADLKINSPKSVENILQVLKKKFNL